MASRKRSPVGATIDQFSHLGPSAAAAAAPPAAAPTAEPADPDAAAPVIKLAPVDAAPIPDGHDQQPAKRDPDGTADALPGAAFHDDGGSPAAHDGEDALADVDALLGRRNTTKAPARTDNGTRTSPRRRQTVTRRRADLMLPDALMADLRELGRPERTGAQRTIGTKFFAAAYVRAVHDLLGDRLDTYGLDRDDEDACVERVKDALRDLLATG